MPPTTDHPLARDIPMNTPMPTKSHLRKQAPQLKKRQPERNQHQLIHQTARAVHRQRMIEFTGIVSFSA